MLKAPEAVGGSGILKTGQVGYLGFEFESVLSTGQLCLLRSVLPI